ncbi:WS/DGAT domain-containing protein [Zoogloea sp.]|uniref:wax ester/triacylglycerol synthase domain-containing protein n=1 Tax=Zoogloea sp. TaxID=49181 RepID=UPI0031FCC7B0
MTSQKGKGHEMSIVERLAGMDLIWLQVEQDTNPAHLTALLVTATPVRPADLAARLAERLGAFERFGQQVLQDVVGAVWEAGHFDPRAQLSVECLPPGEARGALANLAGRLAATRLPLTAPLWHCHLVEHYEQGSALILRVHQCIGDSIALVSLLRSLLDDEPAPAVSRKLPAAPRQENFYARLYAPLTHAMVEGIKISGAFWASYWGLLFNPRQVFDYACANTALALEIGKLGGLEDDGETPLKGRPGGTKQAGWTPPIPHPRIEAIALRHDSSPDAIMLTALGGALRHFLEQRGPVSRQLEIRCLMPANLRNESSDEQLGNRCGLIPFELPVGIEAPILRLHETHKRIRRFEQAYEAQRALGLFNLIGQTPRGVQLQSLKLLATKSSALLLQIPGTGAPRQLCGAGICEEMYWSPPPGDLGVSISVVHSDGHCQLGILADAAMIPQPAILAGMIEAELEALGQLGPA